MKINLKDIDKIRESIKHFLSKRQSCSFNSRVNCILCGCRLRSSFKIRCELWSEKCKAANLFQIDTSRFSRTDCFIFLILSAALDKLWRTVPRRLGIEQVSSKCFIHIMIKFALRALPIWNNSFSLQQRCMNNRSLYLAKNEAICTFYGATRYIY